MVAEIISAGGPVCIRACTSAASGARLYASPDQTMILLGCVIFGVAAAASGVLDIIAWIEKEAERRSKKR